mgnify:CR=1 FL=1
MIVTGTVYDSSTKETLPGAHVEIVNALGESMNPPQGTATDMHGRFSLDVGENQFLKFSFMGMKTVVEQASDFLMQNYASKVYMQPGVLTWNEVVITAKQPKPWKALFMLVGGAYVVGTFDSVLPDALQAKKLLAAAKDKIKNTFT